MISRLELGEEGVDLGQGRVDLGGVLGDGLLLELGELGPDAVG